MQRFYRLVLLVIASAAVFGVSAEEENVKKFDKYTVHYNVFNSTFLQPETARQYGLTRSKSIALVNVTVKNNDSDEAITARVTGNAYNLAGQLKDLAFKEVKDGDSVYYFASFRFANEEQLRFKLEVKPDGVDTSMPVDFKRKLYSDK